ncbi:thymidine kinase [Brachybacterium paraconglomeratum]|uniref:thymidine kinase n=1 Tax=Brachybacterium paraconglomeratum TaxID=173362 RepID=UPI0038042250
MRPMEAGRLQVIAGPMFAGKTEELLRRVHRARLAGRRVEVVGHSLDDRGGADRLSTHLGRSAPARMLKDPEALLELLDAPADGEGRIELLALDEAQFFGPALVPVLEQLLEDGIDVAVAGLCLTYDGEPFSPLPELMARAEEVVKLTAVCTVCGADAAFHIRLVEDGADARRATAAQVGGGESYRARCRAHRDPAAREPRRLR